MWRLILKGVLALSGHPAVREWAKKQARKAIDKARAKADKKVAELHAAAGIEPPHQPKLSRLIRTEKDVLKPGQTVIVEGAPFRIVRLISSSARETVYEGVEA